MSRTVRAARILRPGGPEVLDVLAVPEPEPGPGEVLVRVAYAGLNFLDLYHRTGLYPPGPYPAPIGREGSGAVEATGPGVEGLEPGARVAFLDVPGAYAEKVVARAERLLSVPEKLDLATAAAIPIQFLTAGVLVRTIGRVGPGMTVLVHSAGSGVGRLCCQLASTLGARVLGTCSTQEKLQRAREAGCARAVVRSEESFAEVVLAETEGRGCDLVLDSIGRETFRDSVRATRVRGTLVLYGQSSGTVEPFSPRAVLGSRTLVTASLFDYVADPAELRERWQAALEDLQRGRLSLEIDRVLALAEAAAAHARLEDPARSGKLLLRVGPPADSPSHRAG